MEEINKNDYTNIIKRYSYEQLAFEYAILKKQEKNLYIKKNALDDEFKRRLEEK